VKELLLVWLFCPQQALAVPLRPSDSMIGPAVIAVNMTALVDNIVDDTIVPELEKERFIDCVHR
jgi:hypothetical protein